MSRSRLRKYINASIMFLLITFSFQAKSENIIDRFKKPMPEIASMSEKEFLDTTNFYEELPYGDKALAYTIRLPKAWEKDADKVSSNFQISDKLLSKVSNFHGPATIYGRERVEVKVITLDFDMTAEHWFLQNLMANGYTTEGFTKYDDRRVEAMLLMMEDDISYVLRTAVQVNGKYVIVAEYYVPVDLWDKQAGLQEKVIKSFKIVTPVKETVVKTQPYFFLDIAKINYPETWVEKSEPITSVERLSTKFLNMRKLISSKNWGVKKADIKPIIDGQIEILLIANWATESLLQEINNFKQANELEGMMVGERIDLIDTYAYDSNIEFAATESYKVINNTDNAKDYEFWFTIMISGNYYYFVSLLTPSRSEDFNIWVKNTESYRVIVENTIPSLSKKPI